MNHNHGISAQSRNEMSINQAAQRIADQIETWLNRAAMAYQIGNIELTRQALDYRWQYQKKLAILNGTPSPDPPAEPDEFFKGWNPGSGPGKPGRDPNQPAPVPKGSSPYTGAGEIALTLPENSSEDED